jgi:hypothetical protein
VHYGGQIAKGIRYGDEKTTMDAINDKRPTR